MTALFCILLTVLCAVLLTQAALTRRGLRSAERQLAELERSRSSTHLKLTSPNRALEGLLDQVNILLELRRRDEAAYREREQELRRQIANISHDLRTPLTSILGYLQLLEDEGLPPGERREYLSVVEGRAKALQSLITSFYDLSRLEGGDYPLSREPVDLSAVLSGLLASFYGDFTAAGFDVQVDLAEGLPPAAADPSGVLWVLTNLLRNALDHGRGYLEIKLFQEGDEVISRFGNPAGDVTEEDLPYVFDRFYTADKMRTGRNTGLGLAIVKALTERMGHRVSAQLCNGIFFIEIRWKTAK